MDKKFLEKIPQWYKNNNEKDIILSDDIDGLVSASILRKVKNWEIGYFYDFEDIFVDDKVLDHEDYKSRRVWTDVAILRQECAFDNHVSRKDENDILNRKCINPNIINGVTSANYTCKYAGSTALLIWSIYNLPLPKTEEGKMLLLAIDVTFKGFYDSRFREQNRFYLCDMFGFDELYEVQERHNKEEFYQIINKYNLASKIWVDSDGYLHTEMDLKTISELLGIDIVLPDKRFWHWHTFKQSTSTVYGIKSVKDLDPAIATLAFTYSNRVKYSVPV